MNREELINALTEAYTSAAGGHPLKMHQALQKIGAAGGVPGGEHYTARFEMSVTNVLRRLPAGTYDTNTAPGAQALGITNESALRDWICLAFVEDPRPDNLWPLAGGQNMACAALKTALSMLGAE